MYILPLPVASLTIKIPFAVNLPFYISSFTEMKNLMVGHIFIVTLTIESFWIWCKNYSSQCFSASETIALSLITPSFLTYPVFAISVYMSRGTFCEANDSVFCIVDIFLLANSTSNMSNYWNYLEGWLYIKSFIWYFVNGSKI